MSRFALRQVVAALFLVSFTLPALAGDRLAVTTPDRRGDRPHRLGQLRRCLSILDLTEEQKADIRAILEAAGPALQTVAEAVRAARQKLRVDSNAVPADPCVVGQDFLTLRQSLEKLGQELRSVRDQIAGKLTEEQKARLEGCLRAPRADAASTGEEDAAEE
jgi:Spy/CpxP family protein refolding chaperone